uniref:Transcriptional regulator n=1 Tax=Panagrellus redivivus TaxID=6233 RepID=A0A7E5A1S6_PANRE
MFRDNCQPCALPAPSAIQPADSATTDQSESISVAAIRDSALPILRDFQRVERKVGGLGPDFAHVSETRD